MRRNRPRGIHGLALLAAALLAACGGGDEEGQPREVGEAGGLKVYEVASQGFAIGVPPEWRVVSVDEALPEPAREELARENPDLAPMLEALGDESQPIKLFAFDPEVRDAFATNVNVVAVDVPAGVGLEEFVDANREDIERFAGVAGEIESKRTQLPSGEAERLDYRIRIQSEGAEREVATNQYFLLGDGKGYVVTFSTRPQQAARYEAVFERIVRSLRLD